MGEYERFYKDQLNDVQLKHFWQQMQACGRDRAVSFSLPPVDGSEFCRWMRKDDIHPWFVLFRGRPCGFYFLTEHEGKTAHIHFGTLPMGVTRTASKMSATVGFGLFALSSVLWEQTVSGGYRVDTVLGLTPMCNKEALHFIHKCGAVDCGIWPKACYFHETNENVDGLLTVYTRETVPSWARVM